MTALPSGPFDVVYADPPWRIGDGKRDPRRGTSVVDHYPVMSWTDLMALPVGDICHDSTLLFGWVIQSEMMRCIDVYWHWGFDYCTIAYVWDKERQNLGYYTHPSVELCLLFRKPSPILVPRGSRSERQLIHERSTVHSRKPDCIAESIERLYPTARRVELFARQPRDGWAVWGNEV